MVRALARRARVLPRRARVLPREVKYSQSIARRVAPLTFLCALRYVVVHANLAGFFFCACIFFDLPFRNRNVVESIFVRRVPWPG